VRLKSEKSINKTISMSGSEDQYIDDLSKSLDLTYSKTCVLGCHFLGDMLKAFKRKDVEFTQKYTGGEKEENE